MIILNLDPEWGVPRSYTRRNLPDDPDAPPIFDPHALPRVNFGKPASLEDVPWQCPTCGAKPPVDAVVIETGDLTARKCQSCAMPEGFTLVQH